MADSTPGYISWADELGGLVSRLLALDPKATEENIAQVESLGLKPTTIDEPEAVPAADPASPALNANEAKTKSKADKHADPNSPLYSAKSFKDLNLDPALLEGLYRMVFRRHCKIQERALPLLLQKLVRGT
ncbi:hypothetical protein PSTT_15718 [Puccinia striiformis]|uniref:DEAD-box RNA helicase Q domain-containing protein n=1 Tax=Puccinia striiformis TaxID=27350 RepID=A0A2S4UGE5_9BASI|nr:hypothetical protein PSTT_15718 [Puccinia striiformis]